MPGVTLASRAFNEDDQASFAGLSGDYNPIHVDPAAARRTQAGAVVVHGVHAVLWALDKLIELRAVPSTIASLKVQFTKYIYLGARVDLRIEPRGEHSVKVELVVGALTTTTLILTFGAPKKIDGVAFPSDASTRAATDAPAVYTRVEALAELSGSIDVTDSVEPIAWKFPCAASAIGAPRLAAIAMLSSLVGMICPGLHSLFAAFAIECTDRADDRDRIGYRVSRVDERFRMVQMSVSGAGIDGSVQAFLRWPPITQAALSDIARIVAPTEFAGATALIIGGSRGLGALTAKLIAAGGGAVVVTYATGRAEAERLAEEINGHLGRDACRTLPYDARRDAADQLRTLDVDVTHLYYFATTAITRQKQELFAFGLFDEFVQIYVQGFYDCCRFLRAHRSRTLTTFYPSSVFVENNPLPMTEYGMAKMAGEILCANMNRADADIRVIVNRLPRLLTDQTATVPPVDAGDPLEIMLPIVRRVQSSPSP